VEGENGYFRRNHWVPVPKAASLEVLNDLLLMGCREDERRLIDGRTQRVGQAMAEERDHLLALPEEAFDLAEISFPIVDSGGCVRIKTNTYSTPVGPGTPVQVKVYPAHLEIWHDGRCVARHERCYSRRQQILDLEHYLDVLERKPGAMAGSTALEQWRRAGRWPASFDALWQRLIERQGRQPGTRAMIAVIQLGHGVRARRGASGRGQRREAGLFGRCGDPLPAELCRTAAPGAGGGRDRRSDALRPSDAVPEGI
jgi:hypothetical protein